MRKLILTLAVSTLSSLVMAFTVINRKQSEPISVDPSRPLALGSPLIKADFSISSTVIKNHNTFLNAVGMRESSGDYKAVNRFGYLGKYQFGRQTLNSLGYSDITNREFLSNPELQEQAMEDLLVHNKKLLRKFIQEYEGKVVNGIYITESGILAAAHLAGAGNVKKFFRRGYEFKDGFGTSMTSYMKKFSGYNLDL